MKNYLSEKVKKLTPYVAGIQPSGGGWIKLNTNENPYPPSPKVSRAIKSADIERLRLYPDTDSKELCAAIAQVMNVEAKNVFIGNSSDEVLALAFAAFFGGKQNILMPDISYGYYSVWSEMYDVGAKQIPLNKVWEIQANDYKNAEGVIIANPNAPTGIVLTLSEIETMVVNNPNGVVIIDEAYLDFSDVESAVRLTDKYPNLLVARTFSKSHALAGLRVGFAIGSEELIDGLQRAKNAFNSYPLDMLAQVGAKAAILDVKYWEKTRKQIIATRKWATSCLQELGFNVLPSGANFIFVESKNAKELYEYMCERKILVRYWNKPRLANYLRISIGTNEQMEELISCVKAFLAEKQTKQK